MQAEFSILQDKSVKHQRMVKGENWEMGIKSTFLVWSKMLELAYWEKSAVIGQEIVLYWIPKGLKGSFFAIAGLTAGGTLGSSSE